MTAAGVRQSTQLIYLKRALPEDGAELLSLNQCDSLESAWKLLEARYDPDQRSVEVMTDFISMKQVTKESLDHFVARLMNAASKYARHFPAVTASQLEKMVVDQFIRSVADRRIQEKLAVEEYADIKTALEAAKRIEKFYSYREAKSQRMMAAGSAESEKLASRVAELEEMLARQQLETQRLSQQLERRRGPWKQPRAEGATRVVRENAEDEVVPSFPAQAWSGAQSSGADRGFLGRCFKCKEKGHIRANCPLKQKPQVTAGDS